MKKFFQGILKFISRPIITIGTNAGTEKMVKFLNKHSYIFYILTLLITGAILFVIYFLPYL